MQEKVTLSTSRMTDSDRAAIAAYLKNLPPHPLGAQHAVDPGSLGRGQAIFTARCSACHAPEDQSAAADYPRLAGDTLVMGRDPTTVVRILLEGAQSPETAHAPTGFSMPGFAAMGDDEIADTATYIRNAWGNHAAPVTAADVTSLRRSIAATPEEQLE
jgi:mono/diheme cytochrome c family protein